MWKEVQLPLIPHACRSPFLLAFFILACFETSSVAFVTHSATSYSSSTAAMGIKGFRSWLESQFPDSIVDMPKERAIETFDHVLIDMNQLLHIVLRKSRSDGHGLSLLMKELDSCLRLATPTKSLVLAMDGPPSAAKLATQRKRRFATIQKAEYRINQIDKLLANPALSKRYKPKLLARKKRRAASEIRTLCITPATDFMLSAEQCLLYWAWQRLSARSCCLFSNNVKVFISPSTVAGEGEVKLLEWIYNKKSRKGESIAILGGDSDLVLEGLVIPPSSTHNVFVLLPEGNKRCLSVSLWEITRSLHRILPHLTTSDTTKARTDLALLLIMNGNDYLPKLRGSSGFNKLFHTYIRIQRAWHSAGKAHAFLVNPDTLEFNLEFCIDFFSRLAAIAPTTLWTKTRKGAETETDRTSALQQLNQFAEAGYLPRPLQFKVWRDLENNSIEEFLPGDDEDDNGAEDSGDESIQDDDSEGEEEQILVSLTLGEPGTEDFVRYEIWEPKGFKVKSAWQKLAAMALSDLVDAESDAEDDDDDEDGLTEISSARYNWETNVAVEGKTEDYLYGLLWNLQTYQDGLCDYGFNYGKRLSPTARDIVKFLEESQQDAKSVGIRDLSPGPFTPPVSAGVSCLAALPSTIKHLVPEPYRSLDDETVESIYSTCMDKVSNVFDMKRFERLCDEKVAALKNVLPVALSVDGSEPNGRRIIMGDHSWTVLSRVPKPLTHPFEPPVPFSDRMSKLRSDNRIRISRTMARVEPCPRSAWTGQEALHSRKEGFVNKESKEVIHSDPGLWLKKCDSIKEVDYKTAYDNLNENKRKGLRKGSIKINLANGVSRADKLTTDSVVSGGIDVTRGVRRLRAFNLASPLAEPLTTTDNVTGLACLKQFEDAGLVGNIKWKTQMPSESYYASFDPNAHESVQLVVGKGKVLESDLTYIQDRDVKSTSRQTVKHQLASRALQDIVGNSTRWSSLTFNEIKDILKQVPIIPSIAVEIQAFNVVSPPSEPLTTMDNVTGIACLKQLWDSGFVGNIEWETRNTSQADYVSFDPNSHESVQLIVGRGKGLQGDLRYVQDRKVNSTSRQTVRHYLASRAVQDIIGSSTRWSSLTFNEIKEILKGRTTLPESDA
jgi:hypothetical protein